MAPLFTCERRVFVLRCDSIAPLLTRVHVCSVNDFTMDLSLARSDVVTQCLNHVGSVWRIGQQVQRKHGLRSAWAPSWRSIHLLIVYYSEVSAFNSSESESLLTSARVPSHCMALAGLRFMASSAPATSAAPSGRTFSFSQHGVYYLRDARSDSLTDRFHVASSNDLKMSATDIALSPWALDVLHATVLQGSTDSITYEAVQANLREIGRTERARRKQVNCAHCCTAWRCRFELRLVLTRPTKCSA